MRPESQWSVFRRSETPRRAEAPGIEADAAVDGGGG
jgi:hypothetical protein